MYVYLGIEAKPKIQIHVNLENASKETIETLSRRESLVRQAKGEKVMN